MTLNDHIRVKHRTKSKTDYDDFRQKNKEELKGELIICFGYDYSGN